MDQRKNAPVASDGRGYMIKEVFSNGLVERMKCVIPQHPVSRRKYGGQKR